MLGCCCSLFDPVHMKPKAARELTSWWTETNEQMLQRGDHMDLVKCSEEYCLQDLRYRNPLSSAFPQPLSYLTNLKDSTWSSLCLSTGDSSSVPWHHDVSKPYPVLTLQPRLPGSLRPGGRFRSFPSPPLPPRSLTPASPGSPTPHLPGMGLLEPDGYRHGKAQSKIALAWLFTQRKRLNLDWMR